MPTEGSDGDGLRAARGDDPAARQNLTVVVEEDYAVAQQGPTLFRVAMHNVSGIAPCAFRSGAARLVGAHGVTHSFLPGSYRPCRRKPRHSVAQLTQVPTVDAQRPAGYDGPWVCPQRSDYGCAESVPFVRTSSRDVTTCSQIGDGAARAQIFLSCTLRTEWSAALCKISLARDRVGAMFSTRFGALTAAQIVSATASASASGSAA